MESETSRVCGFELLDDNSWEHTAGWVSPDLKFTACRGMLHEEEQRERESGVQHDALD